MALRIHYDLNGKQDALIHPPYPSETKAFLYCFMSPEKPRIAGELRLRVTTSDDRLSRVGWTSCEQMVNYDRVHFMLFQILISSVSKTEGRTNFVSDNRQSFIDFAFNKPYPRGHLSYTLDDTFIVDFSCFSSSLLNKAWRGYHCLKYFRWSCNAEGYTLQVHIQIAISIILY